MKLFLNAAVAIASVSAATTSNRLLRKLETESTGSHSIIFNHAINRDELLAIGNAAANDEKHAVVDAYLQRASDKAQVELAQVLEGVQYKALPIGAAFHIPSASVELIKKLQASTVVQHIDLNMKSDNPVPTVLKNDQPRHESAEAIEWGVNTVGAPEIWKYFTGKGVVIGSIDTGARPTHEALKANYRADHGWYDPYEKKAPYDHDGHGTHTIGTMIGPNGLGVAPGAQWIACLGLAPEGGDDAHLLECAQFMLCPTNADGSDKDCKKGADVVNNSWGGGGNYDPWMENAIAAWKAANIIPVFAIGNSGPKCSTGLWPGGYDSVISVGAMGSFTNTPSTLAYFSSKGPSTVANGKVIVSPTVAAPGFYTRSATSVSDTDYADYAGTSMASPHVAGVVALLKSADKSLNYDKVYNYLIKTTDQKQLNTTEPEWWTFKNGTNRFPGAPNCGGVADNTWPNNRLGHGRVNVGTILRDGSLHDSRRDAC